MKIYVAAHNQGEAEKVAAALIAAGHEITATWLKEDFSQTASYTEADRQAIAEKDVREVSASDAVVLLPSPYRVPGGKFVEVGVALGMGKPVAVLGQRENMLMWHSRVTAFATIEDLLKSAWLNPAGEADSRDTNWPTHYPNGTPAAIGV